MPDLHQIAQKTQCPVQRFLVNVAHSYSLNTDNKCFNSLSWAPSGERSPDEVLQLIFRLTDQELNRESTLFTHDSVQRGLLKSYIFIAIKLVEAEKQLFQHVGWIGGVPNGFLDKRFGRLPRVVFFQAVC